MYGTGEGARFVRIGQASKILRRSIKQVQGMVERGELRERRQHGHRWFLVAELELLMKKDGAIGLKDIGQREALAYRMLRDGSPDHEIVTRLEMSRQVVAGMRAELEGRAVEGSDEDDADELEDVERANADALARMNRSLLDRLEALARRRRSA